MSKSSVERLIALLNVLSRTERGLGRESIRTAVAHYATYTSDAAFERAFERDKNQLKALGYQLETLKPVSGQTHVRYRINNKQARRAPEFQPDEIAILSALTTVWTNSTARRAISRVLTKLGLNGLTNSLIGTEAYITAPQEFDTLIEAIAESKAITFTYRNAQGETSVRTATAWGIGHRFGQWYLYGFDHSVGDERIFKLDRMRRPKLMNIETHQPPQDFSMSRAIEKISDAKTPLIFIEGVEDASSLVRVGKFFALPLYNWDATTGWIIRHHARVLAAIPDHVPVEYLATEQLQKRMQERVTAAAQKLSSAHSGAPSLTGKDIQWAEQSVTRQKETALDHLTRVLRIAEYVRENAPVSLKETARYFNTTAGKVRKDLELLWLAVDEQSLTLELDRDKVKLLHGADYLVSGAPLSAQEALFLTLTLDQLRRVLPSTTAIDRVGQKIFENFSTFQMLAHRGAIFHATPRRLAHILDAIERRSTLRIRYSTAREITVRTISPQHLILENDSYYVVGWCHLRQAQRKFRVGDLEVVEADYLELDSSTKSAPEDKSDTGTVVIRYKGDNANTQQMLQSIAQRANADRTVFEIEIFNPAWFEVLVTDAGGELEVLSPMDERERVRKYGI